MISLAQLIVVLDATIMNIALPSAQADLGMSDANRHWAITSYTLAFGGLLLLGGRVSDLLGHRRVLMIGLAGFAAASLTAGAALAPGMLFFGRALQGGFAALLAPAALSLLSTIFTDPRERGKAFGVYGAISGGGAAMGLLAGGLLTHFADWRWCLYVFVPLSLIAALGALTFLPTGRRGKNTAGLDVPGVLLSCSGPVALVYGFTRAESAGWGDPLVFGLLGGGVTLLALFVRTEAKVGNPLLPLRVVVHRTRGGAYLAVALSQVAMFGLFLFMTYYMQVSLGYTPIQAGIAFLPLTGGIVVGSYLIAGSLLPRLGPRALIVPALLVSATGMLILTRLEADIPNVFLTLLLPAQILLGLGLGCVMMPAFSTATAKVNPADAGVASATVNAAQQVGGSLGTALLNTVATSVTASYLALHEGVGHNEAAVHGYTVALGLAAGILVATALIVGPLIGSNSRSDSKAPSH